MKEIKSGGMGKEGKRRIGIFGERGDLSPKLFGLTRKKRK
jgi:hypothetical protein